MNEMYERWFTLIELLEKNLQELRSEVEGAYQEFKHNQQQSDKE